MSEEIKPVKSERIDNPDGSYILKEIYDKSINGVYSQILYYNPEGLLVKEQNFSDENFENLAITSNTIYKNNKKIESHDVYEQDQGGWYSIIGKYDLKGRLVQIQEFTDKEFKDLLVTSKRTYNLFGGYKEIVIEENNSLWAKRFYTKHRQLVKQCTYDKTNNKLLNIFTWKYFKSGQLKKHIKKSLYDFSYERYYNENGELILEKSYVSTNKKALSVTNKYEYNNGLLIKEIGKLGNYNNETVTEYKYDENNKKIEEIHYEKNKKDSTISIRRCKKLENGNKNIISITCDHSEIEEYNEEGACIQTKVFEDKECKILKQIV